MYRIDNATAAGSLPSPSTAGPNPDSYFTDGDPGSGTPATIVDAEWANMMQEENCNIIEGAGMTLDKSSRTQLRDAIRKGAGNQYKHTQGSAATQWTIPHNLGTQDHIIQFYDDASGRELIPGAITRGVNSTTVDWGEAQDGVALLIAFG